MQALTDLDARIFYFINGNCRNALLDDVMPWVTVLGSGAFIFALALIMLFLRKNRARLSGILIMAGLTVSHYGVSLLKDLVSRPRPFATLANVNVLVPNDGFSFPSGHASVVFMGAFILGNCFRKGRLAFYAIASLAAVSRVYIGMHYPLDIIAGGAMGTFIGFMLVRLAQCSGAELRMEDA